MDNFFSQKYCDRCGKSLEGGRTMSMLNTDCICMDCKRKERERPDYTKAVEADITEIKKGNFNYAGVGF